MKRSLVQGVVLACALGAGLATPAAAQSKSVAVLPTLYFSAEPQSADNISTSIVSQFEGQGYTVQPLDKSRDTAQSQGIQPSRHYADSVALKFGRAMGAELVVYPRLLAVGIPYANAATGAFAEPTAVILLRVVNVRTGRAIYARQIGHEFRADPPSSTTFVLPQPVADATATEVLTEYFQRIKGSRLER